jgi:alpha-mannosidase
LNLNSPAALEHPQSDRQLRDLVRTRTETYSQEHLLGYRQGKLSCSIARDDASQLNSCSQFEVCGHKYADLSEFGYGVAILSESKYGFSCLGNVLSISLLRAATAPDADQDQGVFPSLQWRRDLTSVVGTHQFSWAVYPHDGHFLESDVPVAGYLYNSPIRGMSPFLNWCPGY